MPDPENCNQYFFCIDEQTPSNTPVSCPFSDPYFDYTTTVCACSKSNVHCYLGANACIFDCSTGSSGHYISDTVSCNVYYQCTPNGMEGPHICSTGTPNFDLITQACVNDPSVCCYAPKPCEPVCDTVGTQIPDPFDCTKFYLCVAVGPADAAPNIHATCDPGEQFNYMTTLCSPLTPCIQPCAVGAEGRLKLENGF